MLISNSKSSFSEIHVRSQWTHSLKGMEPTTFCTLSDALTADLHVPVAGMLLRASYWEILLSERGLITSLNLNRTQILGAKI